MIGEEPNIGKLDPFVLRSGYAARHIVETTVRLYKFISMTCVCFYFHTWSSSDGCRKRS